MAHRTATNVTQSLPKWRGVAGRDTSALGGAARGPPGWVPVENPHIGRRMTRAEASAHPTPAWQNPAMTGEKPLLVTQPLPSAVVERQL